MRKTDSARMLEALTDGRRWSTMELAALGMTPHSRKSDLKKLGYTIEVTREGARVAGEKDVYWYRLEGVPEVPAAIETTLDGQALERVIGMRGRAWITHSPAPEELGGAPIDRRPARANVDRDYEVASPSGLPLRGDVQGVLGAELSPADVPSTPPLPDDPWRLELYAIDDQLSALEVHGVTAEDDRIVDELLDQRDEALGRLSWGSAA